MRTGIVAGFGQPIGAERQQAIREHGFTLIRQDLQRLGGRTPDVSGAIADGAVWEAAGGTMLWIVDESTLSEVPPGSWVELYNEPEYLTPEAYALRLWEAWPTVQARHLTLWAGGIGNLDWDSLRWLERVIEEAPFLTHLAVHRYPADAAQTWTKPHAGFSTRVGEISALRAIIGERPYLVSEVGYHTARRRVWWFWTTRLSNTDQARRLSSELAFWRQHDAAACVIYQEQDGRSSAMVDHYGLRDPGPGAWKTETIYG